jgi:pilus assembly protein CpaB
MDRRFLTVLGVSLLFALVVSGIFYQLSRGLASGPPPAADDERVDLVVAARPLTVGMTVSAEDVKVVKVPKAAFPKGGFSSIEEIALRPVISNILLEEPVLDGRLASKGSGSGLAPVIPAGMRAVSVRVTDVVGVAGFVQPGLKVDVLVTGRPPRGESPVTSTVLQNIVVLSSGTTLAPDARGQAISAQSVTLLVTPEQAETLTLASNEGRIQLVLRNSKDNEVRSTPGSSVTKLYGPGALRGRAYNEPSGEEPEEPRPRPRPAPAPPVPFVPKVIPQPVTDQIVVIRGDKRSVETVLPARSSPSGTEAEEVKP